MRSSPPFRAFRPFLQPFPSAFNLIYPHNTRSSLPPQNFLVRLILWAVVGAACVVALSVGVVISSVYPATAAALGVLILIPLVFGVGGIGASLEAFYWKRIHTLQYGSQGWTWVARLAANPFVRDRICSAAASMSTFQHRLMHVSARPPRAAAPTAPRGPCK